MSEIESVEYQDVPPADESSDDDLTTLLQRREHARPNRMTWALLTLLILTVGFVGGAYANQQLVASSAQSGLPAGFPAGLPAGLPGGPAGGGSGSVTTGAGGLAGMTFGTVKLVDNGSVYITTSSGETVKATVPDTAQVTSQRPIDLSELTPGMTVVIQGETGDDGVVAATSVSEGALPGGISGARPGRETSTPDQGDN